MRTSKAERKRRREVALGRVADGYGFSDVVTFKMAHLCTSAQRVALKAEQAGQYAAAIGALKLLHEMVVVTHTNPKERTFRRGLR